MIALLTENQKSILLTGKTLEGKDATKRKRNVLCKATKKANAELKRMTQSLVDIDFLMKLSDTLKPEINPLTKRPKKNMEIRIDPELLLNVMDTYVKQVKITRREREVDRLPLSLGKLPPGICRTHSPSGTKWIQILGTLNDHGEGTLKKEFGPRVDFIYKLLERTHQSICEMRITYDEIEKKYAYPYDPKNLIIIEKDDKKRLTLSQTHFLHYFVENYVKEKIGIELTRLADDNYIKEKINNLSELAVYGNIWAEGYKEVSENGDKPNHILLGRY